jgi:hypothetical protein
MLTITLSTLTLLTYPYPPPPVPLALVLSLSTASGASARAAASCAAFVAAGASMLASSLNRRSQASRCCVGERASRLREEVHERVAPVLDALAPSQTWRSSVITHASAPSASL